MPKFEYVTLMGIMNDQTDVVVKINGEKVARQGFSGYKGQKFSEVLQEYGEQGWSVVSSNCLGLPGSMVVIIKRPE